MLKIEIIVNHFALWINPILVRVASILWATFCLIRQNGWSDNQFIQQAITSGGNASRIMTMNPFNAVHLPFLRYRTNPMPIASMMPCCPLMTKPNFFDGINGWATSVFQC